MVNIKIEKPAPPYVYIAGAGPGAKELLTLKTYLVLTQIADVVIHDRLIPDAILDCIPKKVKKIYVGKSCKEHHCTQEEINISLVEEAKKGKVVLRLKGGDPFIFGRGGEEVAHLIAHHIPFEVVPGVNAADGCAAYHGIPLTHRGLASGVRFITGHQQKDKPLALDWKSLADPDTTLVIFMGLASLPIITEQLIAHGMPSHTPAVAIQEGTLPTEKTCFSPLGSLAQEVKKAALQPPTLVIIGKVVALGA